MVQSEIGHFTWPSRRVGRGLGKANSYWQIFAYENNDVVMYMNWVRSKDTVNLAVALKNAIVAAMSGEPFTTVKALIDLRGALDASGELTPVVALEDMATYQASNRNINQTYVPATPEFYQRDRGGNLIPIRDTSFVGIYLRDDEVPSGEGNDPGAIGNPTFTLTWSYTGGGEGPDIDLWVTDPTGKMLTTSRDGYGLGPTPEGGKIDYDDRGASGSGDGGGPERAYWPTGQAPSGTYSYGVRYYSGSGTANYTVHVYKNGSLVGNQSGSFDSTGGRITLGSVQAE